MKFEIKHLSALFLAALTGTFGVFLWNEFTGCEYGEVSEGCTFADSRIYGHRPYGIALVVIAVAFSAAIIRHAKKETQT